MYLGKEFLMAPPPKNSIFTRTLTLTLYDQHHWINLLIIKYTNPIFCDSQQFYQYQQNNECLNSDSQQFYQYQQNKECLNSDSQQFYQYQQNNECLNSDSQQFYQYQQNKECLNSDSQQFYKYQQCQQSPLTLTQVWNRKKTTTYNDVWNSCPISGQEHKCGRIKPVMMGFQVHVVVYNTCIIFYSTMSTCISML